MAKSGALVFVLALLLFSTVPMPTSAEDSGGVQASSSTVSIITPGGTPTEGGTVTIRLTLWNDNTELAEDVLYKLYWDGVEPSKLMSADVVDIPGKTSVDIDFDKSGLTVGEHQVWIVFDYNGAGEQMFFKEFTVYGRPDLEAEQIAYSPITGLNFGDSVEISTLVSNTGSEDAGVSRMQIALTNQTEILNVSALAAGTSEWVNITLMAPDSGTHSIVVTVDLDDAIDESDESNTFSEEMTVEARMDISHIGQIEVEVPGGSLEGPWTFSGTLLRTGGSGNTSVPMKLEISDGDGGILPISPFVVNMSGGTNVQTPWLYVLEFSSVSGLLTGSHTVTAVIDPFGSALFVQETEENDRLATTIEKYEIPDVVVDPIAAPSTGVTDGGSSVWWNVTITNTAEIDVRGKIIYTWEGVTINSTDAPVIPISSGDTYVWNKRLETEYGSHEAYFTAHWVALEDSYDALFSNSIATGKVTVTSQLQLDLSTLKVLDSYGEIARFPLMSGDTYILQISLISEETGTVNLSCQDAKGHVWAVEMIEITEMGQFVEIICEFVATSPRTNIVIVPDDENVATKSWNWQTNVRPEDDISNKEDAAWGTVVIIGAISFGLIGVLIAAVILTRETEEEVERDIFDYCPACDGELEGGEDRCPSCSFNLKKARMQFHDCEECRESIPDLLSNCPYCGATQDVSKYFEKRERKEVVKKTIALPDEEEIDPEQIHAAGYEDFDEAVKEFGYNLDDLEDHWDESIAKAEVEVEAAYDRRIAAAEEEEMDDEEAMATVTTTLKSVEESFEGHDIDAFLSERDDLRAHIDDGSDLSASDAKIRERLFEITGEKGVMPGDEVRIGMGIVDRSLAGNELPEDVTDFSFDEEEFDEVDPVTSAVVDASRRRGIRRKQKQKIAECGSCGADIPVEATECLTCGAKFE